MSGIPVARLSVVDEMSNSLLGSEGPGSRSFPAVTSRKGAMYVVDNDSTKS